MADHYTHSAFELKATKEQYDWLSKITNIVYLIGLGDATKAQIRVFKEELGWTDDLPDFWGWVDQPIQGGVHFSMEECGNIDLMAEILKVYLGKFYPSEHVFFEWAVDMYEAPSRRVPWRSSRRDG